MVMLSAATDAVAGLGRERELDRFVPQLQYYVRQKAGVAFVAAHTSIIVRGVC